MSHKTNTIAGYTIVEVMIFMLVSSALMISALAVVSGRQQRTEFTQSVREADAAVQDVMNDYATGFFRDDNFSCTAPAGGGPVVVSASVNDGQGARAGCAFIGKVIHFAPVGSDGGQYNVVTVVGRQFQGDILSDLVTDLGQARPRALYGGTNVGGVNLTDIEYFSHGLKIESVVVQNDAGQSVHVGAIGFFSSFSDNDPVVGTVSGKQTTQVVAIGGSSLNSTPDQISSLINNIGNGTTIYVNRPITICFQSPGTDQRGLIRIGDNRRQVATSVTIEEGGSCPVPPPPPPPPPGPSK
jgi:type II secretory pathway pseudopilin PulG